MGLNDIKCKHNTILLSGISFKTIDDIKLVQYSDYSISESLLHHQIVKNEMIIFDVSSIHNRYILIETNEIDVVKNKFPNVEIIPSNARYIVFALINDC